VATYHTLDALGDGRRRAILEHLRGGPASVGQIAARLPVSRPAVSQHLRVLEAAHLVRYDAVGTSRVYRLDPDGADAVRAWLDDLWTTALDAYARRVASSDGPPDPDDTLRSTP
jgi:DNA-binding transcriptional ArsR family regulator